MNKKTKKSNSESALKIMRKLRPIAVLFISFLLMGCPMKSKFSLVDKPTMKIDQRLLGDWGLPNPDLKDRVSVTEVKISQFSTTEYELLVTKSDEKDYKPSTFTFRAYLAHFEGDKWLIVNDEEEEINYFFKIIKIRNNKLIIQELASRATDLNTEKAFRNYAKRNPLFHKHQNWAKH